MTYSDLEYEIFSRQFILQNFDQKNIHKLLEEVGDKVVSISLDTDVNEDENTVKAHINNNNFDGLYAISSKELTESLIDQFGVGVVNAPSAPVVLICEDQSARLLQRGLKSIDELKEELSRGC